jgi:hypothetical protein
MQDPLGLPGLQRSADARDHTAQLERPKAERRHVEAGPAEDTQREG